MAARGRFLFVSWDGGGNVPPALALGQRLLKAGHAVTFLASNSLDSRAAAAGLTFQGFREMPEWGTHLRRRFEDEEYLNDLWLGPAVGHDVMAQLARDPADVIVVDASLCGAMAAAEQAAMPWAALIHILYHLNVESGARYTELWDQCLPDINQTREIFRLSLLEPGQHAWDAATFVFALTPREFDRPMKSIPANVRYVGPVFGEVTSADQPLRSDADRPLILISFSTTYQRQERIMQRVIDALIDLPVEALVTAGPAIDAGHLHVGANVTVVPYLDHQAVLPSVAAVVTHAGLSTVMAALAHGVPLLCLPMGRDQDANAERVAACSAGLSLNVEASSQEIRASLLEVIESPALRSGAKRMQALIARYGNGSIAVDLLERVLPERVGAGVKG